MKIKTGHILIGAGILGGLALLSSRGKKKAEEPKPSRATALNTRTAREKETTLDGSPLYSGSATLTSIRKGIESFFADRPTAPGEPALTLTPEQFQQFLEYQAEESSKALSKDYTEHWRKTYQVLEAELPGSAEPFMRATTPSFEAWVYGWAKS